MFFHVGVFFRFCLAGAAKGRRQHPFLKNIIMGKTDFYCKTAHLLNEMQMLVNDLKWIDQLIATNVYKAAHIVQKVCKLERIEAINKDVNDLLHDYSNNNKKRVLKIA